MKLQSTELVHFGLRAACDGQTDILKTNDSTSAYHHSSVISLYLFLFKALDNSFSATKQIQATFMNGLDMQRLSLWMAVIFRQRH